MRYLWGQGRAIRDGVEGVGGIVGVVELGVGSVGCVEVGSDVEVDGEVWPSGDVLVGPLSTKLRIRSGVFAGVTLSINWNAGRRRTVVLWSEWSGTGRFEAESMSFYVSVSTSAHSHNRRSSMTYPVTRLHVPLIHCLHNTPLLVRNISHPVRLASPHNQMRTPPLHMPIQLFRLIDRKL